MKLNSSTTRLGIASLGYVFLACVIAACGGGSQTPTDNNSSGGETPVVLGPPPSFLPADYRVLVRANGALIRTTPVAADMSTAMRGIELWQRLAGSSGLDPVRDLDALTASADGFYGTRRVAVLRYAITEVALREAVTRMAAERGTALDWHEVLGHAVVTLPVDVPVAHSLVLTADHEAVIAPSDDVQRIVQVAVEQEARRRAPTDVIEPGLALHANEVATLISSDEIPMQPGFPPLGQPITVQVMHDAAGGRFTVALQSVYADPAVAEQAAGWLRQNAANYAQNFLVRSTGLSRPLEALVVQQDGGTVNASTDLTMDEARRALGASALLRSMPQ